MELAGVGATALGVARVRAAESARGDRLFDDPYAAAFVAAAPPGTVPTGDPDTGSTTGARDLARLGAAFHAHAVLRTRFFDDYLLAAGARQVVLLAAGLDTRAHRLAWPEGTRLFELDHPGVLAFKQRVLDADAAVPRCTRQAVPADLRADWPRTLTAHGFDPAAPTAWLAEGLLVYLSATEADHLLRAVTDLSPPGSRIALEDGDPAAPSVRDAAANLPAMRRFTALWKGGLDTSAATWLAARGWHTHTEQAADLAARYRRAPVEGRFTVAIRT